MNTSKVTRFEVIDHRVQDNDLGHYTGAVRGRVLTEYNVQVELSLQDDGRTLKVFINEEPCDECGNVHLEKDEPVHVKE